MTISPLEGRLDSRRYPRVSRQPLALYSRLTMIIRDGRIERAHRHRRVP